MECAPTKTLNGASWPLHKQSDNTLCSYKVDSTRKKEIAEVIADAETKAGYKKRSRLYTLSGGKYRVYVYFQKA